MKYSSDMDSTMSLGITGNSVVVTFKNGGKSMREEIMNGITEAIRAEVGKEFEVSLREVKKNNGLTLQTIEIWEPGTSICLSIYIDSLLDRIAYGEINVNEAAQKVIKIHEENKDNMKFYDVVRRIDKQAILEKAVYQLINEEKNRERLRDIPHRKFLDLAAVYRVIVREDQYGTESFMVTNAMCDQYGIGKEELDHAARQNTEKKGFEVQTMASIIAETEGMTEEVGELECPMWVLSNTQKFNGAVVMLYNGYFRRLAESIRSDLYVLPSSIHEVIAVPVDGIEPCGLKAIVGEVNFCEVKADEILSENVYWYSRKDGNISIADVEG